MAATEKVTMLPLTLEDIDALRDAVTSVLDDGPKLPHFFAWRKRLYSLNRRLYRARLKLEE